MKMPRICAPVSATVGKHLDRRLDDRRSLLADQPGDAAEQHIGVCQKGKKRVAGEIRVADATSRNGAVPAPSANRPSAATASGICAARRRRFL